MRTRVEYFKDKAGLWRWRAIAAENGNVIADSGQGYEDKDDAEAMVVRLLMQSPNTVVEEVTL